MLRSQALCMRSINSECFLIERRKRLLFYTKMADPKYANLPGIDHNSPDVYETDDLPEEDQQNLKNQASTEDDVVEKIGVDTKAAFDTFKGKIVESSGLDFSDRISKNRRTGYAVSQEEYEMLEYGSRSSETPQQKYQRLQHEIRELAEEVNKIKDNIKDEKSSEMLSPVAMGKQVEYLKHQLADLHLEKLLGPEVSVDLSDPQGAIRQRLLTQLESYKPSQSEKTKAVGKDDHVLYELYYKPEQAQFSKNARIANLEERLDRLTSVVGQNTGKMSVLTTDTENKSLVGSMSVLNTKLSLLDPANIEQIEARLQTVLHKLGQISEKKPVQEDSDKDGKISELYELVKKWEATVDTLPEVVTRLTALKDLHEQALQFSQSLSHLNVAQQEVASSLLSHGDMLKQLQLSFQENAAAIKQNCDSMEARIQALKKS